MVKRSQTIRRLLPKKGNKELSKLNIANIVQKQEKICKDNAISFKFAD